MIFYEGVENTKSVKSVERNKSARHVPLKKIFGGRTRSIRSAHSSSLTSWTLLPTMRHRSTSPLPTTKITALAMPTAMPIIPSINHPTIPPTPTILEDIRHMVMTGEVTREEILVVADLAVVVTAAVVVAVTAEDHSDDSYPNQL